MSVGLEDKLQDDEVGLLGSVLEFAGKTVGDVMVCCPIYEADLPDEKGGRVFAKRGEDCGKSSCIVELTAGRGGRA